MRLLAQVFLIGAAFPGMGVCAFAQAGSGESPSPRKEGLVSERPASEPTRGTLARIASPAAGGNGIVVRVVAPATARYRAGAPVAIAVSPGSHDAYDAGRLGVAPRGFMEVYFSSPDGGAGPYDFGGPDWILGVRDVIRFVLGRTKDEQGRTIQDLAGAVPALTSNVGIVGFSHGGNACGAVMALHGQDIAELAYYVSWESPYGEGAVGEELGSQRDEGRVNPAYDPQTGILDLSKLAYDPELPQRRRAGRQSPQTLELPFRGSLFFDMDGDGRYSPDTDYRHQPVMWDAGAGPKFWYSIRLLREAEECGLFGGKRPAHIPAPQEAAQFWRCRDATGLVPDAVRKIPGIAVIVVAHETDHMQAAPDHPHICTQVNAFVKAGARFVRLNPDRAYVEGLSPRKISGAPDNDAGTQYDGKSVRAALCPNDIAPGPSLASVAVCELADRVQAGNFAPNLDRVLFPDTIESMSGKAGRTISGQDD